MKKSLLISSLFLSATLFSMNAEEVTTTIANINYSADSEGTTATVTKSSKAEGEVVIPQTVEIEGKTYTVTALAASAFSANSKITSMQLPSTVTSIGEKAFNLCSKLTKINIPDGITVLNNQTFGSCKLLASIEIPTSVTKLDSKVFYKCEKLTSIELHENINSIGFGCFNLCTGLKSIVIPEGITELASSVFEGCSALESIEIPATVTAIEDNAFNSTAITTVTLPVALTKLGQAFGTCDKLTTIVIPDGVAEIQGSTFNKCTALESVTLGSGVTDINEFAFNQCTAIKSVTVNATTPPTLNAGAFPEPIFSAAKLTVPDASVDAYKAADVWKNFSEIANSIEVVAAEKTVVDCYTITGNKVSEGYRGIVIVRYSDGSVAKQLKR